MLSLWQRLPGVGRVRWLNGYGPTETSVVVTTHEVESAAAPADTIPSAGLSPTPGLTSSTTGQPVPVGVTEYLHIGSTCLARGYLNSPATRPQQQRAGGGSSGPAAEGAAQPGQRQPERRAAGGGRSGHPSPLRPPCPSPAPFANSSAPNAPLLCLLF